MMAMSRSVLRAVTYAGGSPGHVLEETNRILFDDLVNASLFFSAFHVVYTPGTRELVYSNAGHNPPFVVRAGSGERVDVTTDGMLVGLLPEWTAEEKSMTLARGDVFVMYTDGIVEATDTADRMYGDRALFDSAVRAAALPAAGIVAAVLDDVSRFSGGGAPADDTTILVLKVV
jgi:sigma-B regulation protein RsbU (phosphoserine phosphatase)